MLFADVNYARLQTNKHKYARTHTPLRTKANEKRTRHELKNDKEKGGEMRRFSHDIV